MYANRTATKSPLMSAHPVMVQHGGSTGVSVKIMISSMHMITLPFSTSSHRGRLFITFWNIAGEFIVSDSKATEDDKGWFYSVAGVLI
jgi:hypothetical protein